MSNVTALGGVAAAELTVTLRPTEQALAIFPGDGTVTLLDDTLPAPELVDLFRAPIQNAVICARLRAWADLIERTIR